MKKLLIIAALLLAVAGEVCAQQGNQSVPSGSGSSSASTPKGSIDPTSSIYAGGVKADSNIYLNGAFSFPSATAGNPVTVTCSACVPAPSAADVGKIMQATSWDQSSADVQASTILGSRCTITGATATTWTCAVSNTWSASTGTGVLMVGHDDTAAWAAANAAVIGGNSCGTMWAPLSGITLVQTALFNAAPPCLTPVFGNSFNFLNYQMGGTSGGGLTFAPTTDFTAASCPGTGNTYFFGFAGAMVSNFTFNGFGINPGGAQTCNVFSTGGGQLNNVYAANWQNTSLNVTGINFCGIAGGPFITLQGGIDGVGNNSAQVSSASTNCYGIQGWFFQNARNFEMLFNGGTSWECFECGYFHGANAVQATLIQMTSGGSAIEYNPQFVSNRAGAQLGVNMNNGATYIIEGSASPFILNSGSTATTAAFASGGTGPNIIKLHNMQIQGGATGCAIANAATGTRVYLEEGAQVLANCALANPPSMATTGFGTGTIALAGNVNSVEAVSFTITPTGAPATSGTIVETFNQSLPVAPRCDMQLGNGTESWTAPLTIIQGAITTTTATFNWTAGAAPGTTGTLLGTIFCQVPKQ